MPVAEIEDQQVTAWMVAHIEEAEPPFTFQPIPGGNSNLTYRVRDGAGTSFALRRPPLSQVVASAHDMVREYRVISALQDTGVPVPKLLGLCTDPEVNGVPFYVMRFVEGVVLHDRESGASIPEAERNAVARSVVEGLASLHALEPHEIGLGSLGRPDGYLKRQLYGWSRQLAGSKRQLAALEAAPVLLEARIPPQVRTCVVHGDYRLGNLIVGGGQVRAVVDWELCTLGDPLADLGYLANDWIAPDERMLWRSSAIQNGGFPSRQEMVDRYARLSGADVSALGYYQAFQWWRLAAILEGVLTRYLDGSMPNLAGVDLGEMGRSVERLANRAVEQLES